MLHEVSNRMDQFNMRSNFEPRSWNYMLGPWSTGGPPKCNCLCPTQHLTTWSDSHRAKKAFSWGKASMSPSCAALHTFNILQFSLEFSGRQSCSAETGSVRRMTFAVLDTAERERGETET